MRKPLLPTLAVLALATGLAGCGHDDAPDPLAPPTGLIYSPNGEPLNGGPLGRPTCREALGRWFDRVDASHGGVISRDQFLADARAQFKRMDIDGDGFLVPEELERYRLPYRQPRPARSKTAADAEAGETGGLFGGHRHRNADANGADAGTGGAGHAGRSDAQPDPVMSADVRMAFKVSLDDFLNQANAIFTRLTATHPGGLERETSLAPCQPKP